jgi:predicted nucleic acid-binding protein
MPSVTATWPDRAVHPAVLDTDVASLLHRRQLTGPLATRLIGREPLITFITYGELTKWAEIRRWGTRRREELMGWLSGIPVLPGDEAVATIWGRLSQLLSAAADLVRLTTCGSQPVASLMRYRSRRLTSKITRISRSITGCASSAPNNRRAIPAGSHLRPPLTGTESREQTARHRIGEPCNQRSLGQRLPFRCDLLDLERGWQRCTAG